MAPPLSTCVKTSLELSIISSAFSKYVTSGKTALKAVLPEADLQVNVATGSPGLNVVKEVRNMKLNKINLIAVEFGLKIRNEKKLLFLQPIHSLLHQ